MGMFVVPTVNDPMASASQGNRYPRATPAAMAVKTQSVRYLSQSPKLLNPPEFISLTSGTP